MTLRNVLAIRHVALDDLGLLAPVLDQRGCRVDYVTAGVEHLDTEAVIAADLLVTLGGPLGIRETTRTVFLTEERAAIAERLALGKPTLGICLGAQLMAQALGADVTSNGTREIGYRPLTLTDAGHASSLRHLGPVPVLHWHGYQFEIPAGAKRLAETPGFPNQVFSVGPGILGLQCHLEADYTRIERWLTAHTQTLIEHRIDPEQIRRDAAEHGPALSMAANRVFADWVDGLRG
ncbi:glutamine amidotransferase [Luteimonas sp. RIT-PG2_3]